MQIIELLKSNLDIDLSVNTVRCFIRNQRYHDQLTHQKYFISAANGKNR